MSKVENRKTNHDLSAMRLHMVKKRRIEKGFFEYFVDEERKKPLRTILMGHLVIENLLVEAIETQLDFPKEFDPYKIDYPEKVDLCVGLGILPSAKKQVYLKVNNIRNKFAHELNYEFTFDDALQYVDEMKNAGFVFLDKEIEDLSKDDSGLEGLVLEILEYLSIDLIDFLHDYGVDIPQ
jgi:predicted nucleotidyltransferase